MKRKKWKMLLLLLFMVVCVYPVRAEASNVRPTPTEIPVTLIQIFAYYRGEAVKVGDQISRDDIEVTGIYSDGTSETITDFVLTSDRVLVDGENTFMVISGGKTAKITVLGKKEKSIYAMYDYSAGPVSVGNSVGKGNVAVRVTYSDYSMEEVDDFVLSNAVISTVGTQKVMVSYKGMTAEISVPTVAAKNVVGLYVSYLGEGEVTEGHTVPESDLTVLAIYSDGSEIIHNYTMSKITELGENIVVVSYRGQSATFTINCIPKELKEIEAVYKGGRLEVGEYVDPDNIVATAIYEDGSKEEVKEFNLLNARILAVGKNYVTVSYEGKRVDIEIEGLEKTTLNYSHAASFQVKNEAKQQAKIQIPLPKKMSTTVLKAKSLKTSSVSRVMRMIKAQDAEYIAFEVGPEDETMDDIFPLLMKITIPSTFDIEYTSVYYTSNRKTMVGRLNAEVLKNKELELTIYLPGTYIICYQKPAEEDPEEVVEDDYLD